MTQRERQILNWIEADPTISQQELADRAETLAQSEEFNDQETEKKQ